MPLQIFGGGNAAPTTAQIEASGVTPADIGAQPAGDYAPLPDTAPQGYVPRLTAEGVITYMADIGPRVNDFGADPTGTNDSTAAFAAAVAAAGTTGIIVLGVGTYKLGSTGTNLPVFARYQGMVAPGSQLCTLSYHGSGTCVSASDGANFGDNSNAGPFQGFSVDGTNASAGAVGFAFGNLTAARNTDITVSDFSGTGSIGVNLLNTDAGYAEQGVWLGIRAVNNTNNYVLNTGSHDYCYYDFYVDANADQNGLLNQDGATCVGCHLSFKGNFHTGATNTGVAWQVGTGSSDESNWSQCTFQISCETDGATVAHQSIKVDTAGGTYGITGSGSINFATGSVAFGTYSSNADFGVSPFVQVPGLGFMSNGESLTVPTASLWNIAGGPYSSPYDGNIYWQQGDVQMALLTSGANTLAFNGVPSSANTSGKQCILFLLQPASGTAATVTWPSNVKWPSGTAPTLSSTDGDVDKIRLVYIPQTNYWYGNLDGTNYH